MGSKILIVDDELDVGRGWARTLRIEGHDVQYASGPDVALQLSASHPFDLVIADYIMPGMTGIELLNRIREDHPFIRSIIISGKLDANASEETILADIRTNVEADLFLHKPVENSRLKEAVAALLAEQQSADWQTIAATKLSASKARNAVRATEKLLNKKRSKTKKK